MPDPEVMDLLRRGYDAFNQHDWDALGELLAPDIEVHRAGGLGEVHGAGDTLGFMKPDAFEWQRLEIDGEVVQRGDRLFVPLRNRVRGKGSEIELEGHAFHVVTVQTGRLRRIEVFFDRDEAMAVLEARPA